MTKSNQEAAENRRLQRWHLIFYLRAFDKHSGLLIGHVVDISIGGMMLISDKPIPPDTDLDFWIDIPVDELERERIVIKAHSLWCKRDVNPDFYNTGLRLVDASAEILLKIQLLIDDLKF